MKQRLLYILFLSGLLLLGGYSHFSKPAITVSTNHTVIKDQSDNGLLGTMVPDLPLPQLLLDEDDSDTEEFSSIIRRPVYSRTSPDTGHLFEYASVSNALTAFCKKHQRSAYPVSDITISQRTFRI